MKVRMWGTRGSIPSPIRPAEIEKKIYRALLDMPDIDTSDPEAVWAYVRSLPPLVRSTAGGNTACVEVRAGEHLLILDAGSGLYPLGRELMEGPCGRGTCTLHLLISHLHWDHIHGFPMFSPAFVPGNRIIIYGSHDDLRRAFEMQQCPITWPISLEAMQADISFVHIPTGSSFQIGDVRIATIRNAHPGGSYSFRIEHRHSVLVYATDAEYKELDDASVQPYIEFFRNADALIFDAQYTLKESWKKEDWGHSSAMIGVDLARAAGIKRLLLFHHDPTYSDDDLENIRRTALAYQAQDPTLPTCEVIVAYEGMELELTPPGTVDLQFTSNGETAILTPSLFDERGIKQLALQLERLDAEDSPANSIVDLSQVETLTTGGLKALVALYMERGDAPIVLAAPSESVRRVIELGGYADFFAVYPSVQAALTAVQAREKLNLPGQILRNRYRVERHIGEGRLGTVLQATDMYFNRRVAIKVLSPAFSQATIERFLQQAQRIAALEHPNIVKVYEWSQDGELVLGVEEFVDWPTLDEILAGDITPEQYPNLSIEALRTPTASLSHILSLIIDITRALDHAHSRGVILGDLKPANVFLTDRGAKVSGFGLGRLVEGRNLLETPRLFLSADYLAPEQILGHPLDARTDLYALGVLIYRLITGHLPYEEADLPLLLDAEDARSAEAYAQAVMQAHLRRAPRSPRALNPRIPITLEHLVLKLLARNPNDRYASARQVQNILNNLLASADHAISPRQTILVGREKPLQTLLRCWQNVREGHGQLAFISGDPGIGKTRLARQVAVQGQPSVFLVGQCLESGQEVPYHPFVEVLRNYFATIPPEFSDEEVCRFINNFAHLVPELQRMLPQLPISPLPESQHDPLRLMASVTQFIRRAATPERPWLIILDDLQWADQNSLDLLLYLGRHLPSMALMLIGTYCDLDLPPGHPLLATLRELGGYPGYRHIALTGLSQVDVGHMLTYIWRRPVPPFLVERIHKHTNGNPFYVEELARELADEGMPPSRRGGARATTWNLSLLDEVRLPRNVHETILRRISHLSVEAQSLLRQAAVLGMTFRFDDLCSLSGLSEWEVLERLGEALERHILIEIPQEKALRFRQTELYRALHENLGPVQRRLLHHRAAEALERRAQVEDIDLSQELAHHYSEAGAYEKALHYTIQAGHRARLAYANDTAIIWYRRALEIVNSLLADGRTNAHLLTMHLNILKSLGEIMVLTGHYSEAMQHLTDARALLEAHPDLLEDHTRHLADLCRRTAQVHERRDECHEALTWLEKGLAYIGNTTPSLEAAQIYLLGARVYHRQGENAKAARWCQMSLDIASQLPSREGQQVVGQALYQMAVLNVHTGDLQKAVQLARQSVTTHEEIDDRVGQADAYNILAIAHDDLGDWDRAIEAYYKSWMIRQEIGDVYGQAASGNNLAEIHVRRGEWDQAVSLYEQSLALWRQIGAVRSEAVTLMNLGHVYLRLGELDRAQQYLDQARARFAKANSREYLPELERLWGELYLLRRQLDQAHYHARYAVELAHDSGSPLEEGIAYRLLGEIHIARKEYGEALKALHASLRILSDLQSRYEVARTRLALARLASEGGQLPLEEARHHLAEAIRTFEQLDARADLRAAQALNQRLQNGPSPA